LGNGYIYLLECVSDWETTYKIGYTRNKDIKKRIKGLQTGNKDRISCVELFYSKHGRKIETSLHNLYSHKRMVGEWFSLELFDVANFQMSCEKLEENFNMLEEYDNPFL